ncbi:MAG: hypothetical protein V3U52_01255 [Thermoplasmata archaeon]
MVYYVLCINCGKKTHGNYYRDHERLCKSCWEAEHGPPPKMKRPSNKFREDVIGGQRKLYEMMRAEGYDVLVQHAGGMTPSRRHDYWNCLHRTKRVRYRQISPNLVVIDVDFKRENPNLEAIWEKQKPVLQALVRVLREFDIPYWLSYSGGYGFHIEIWLKGRGLNGHTDRASAIRQAFVTWLCEEAGVPFARDKIDPLPVKSKGSNVTEVGHWRGETGTFKTLIDEVPEEHPCPDRQPPLRFPSSIECFDIEHIRDVIETVEATEVERSNYNIKDKEPSIESAATKVTPDELDLTTPHGEISLGQKYPQKVVDCLRSPDPSHKSRAGMVFYLGPVNWKRFGRNLYRALLYFFERNNVWVDWNPLVTEYHTYDILHRLRMKGRIGEFHDR